MKKITFTLLLLLCLTLGCEKIDYGQNMPPYSSSLQISEDKDKFIFDCEAHSASITFKVNYAWRVKVKDPEKTPWLTVKSPEDNKPGEQEVFFEVAQNDTDNERVGYIVVYTADTLISVPVKQYPREFTFLSENDTIYLDKRQQDTILVLFHANTDWTAMVDEDAKSWLSVETSGFREETKCVIKVTENKVAAEREGKITIKGVATSFVLTVLQDYIVADADFVFDEQTSDIMYLDKREQDTLFAFHAQVEWKATVEDAASTWLSIEASGIKSRTRLLIKVKENNTSAERVGKITVESLDGNSSFVIEVHQDYLAATADFVFGETAQKEIYLDKREQDSLFDFHANVEWRAVVKEDASSWLSVETSGIKSTTKLLIKVKENSTSDQRMGEITVESLDGNSSFVIKVYQSPAFEFAEGTDFTIWVDFEEDDTTFKFISNIDDWSFVVESSATWLTVTSESTGKGEQTLNIHYARNEQDERTGKITVSSGNSSFDIYVKQFESKDFVYDELETQIKVAYTAGMESFTFKSNVSNWTASVGDGSSWLTLTDESKQGGSGTQTLTFNFQKNNQVNDRYAVITVTNGRSTITINVVQATAPDFETDGVETNIMTDYKGDSKQIVFTANCAWGIDQSSLPSWVEVSPISGVQGENKSFTITIKENPTIESRNGVLKVVGVSSSFSINISQTGRPEFEFENTNYEIYVDYDEGDTAYYFFTANTAWTVTKDVDWLSFSPEGGIKGNKLRVNIHYNATDLVSEREGKITVTGNKENFVIVIKQAGRPDFEFDEEITSNTFQIETDYKPGSKTFTFKSNVDWTAESSDITWLTLDEASKQGGKGTQNLIINFTEQNRVNKRQATIQVKSGNNLFNIVVSQDSSPNFVYPSAKIGDTIYRSKTYLADTFKFNVDFRCISWTALMRGEFPEASNVGTTRRPDNSLGMCARGNDCMIGNTEMSIILYENKLGKTCVNRLIFRGLGLEGDEVHLNVMDTFYFVQPGRPPFEYNESETDIKLKYTKTDTVFKFKPNLNGWEATVSSDASSWLTLTNSQGNMASELIKLGIHASENPTASMRQGTITVRAEGEEFTITVKQAGRSEFEYDNDEVWITDYKVNSASFTFKANVAWEKSSSDDWLTISPASGAIGEQTVTITPTEENPTASLREGQITLRDVNNPDNTFIIYVKHPGRPAFEYDETKLQKSINYPECDEEFHFRANIAWWLSYEVDEPWITATPSSSDDLGEVDLKIHFATNPTMNVRTGKIKIYAINTDPVVIDVTQAGRPYFEEVDRTDKVLDYTVDTVPLTFTCNGQWLVQKAHINGTNFWMRTLPESGVNDFVPGVQNIKVVTNTENPSSIPRWDTMRIDGRLNVRGFQFLVRQKGRPVFEFADNRNSRKEDIVFNVPVDDYKGMDSTFIFKANLSDWKAEVNESWISFEEIQNESSLYTPYKDTLKVIVEENETAESRTAEVIVKSIYEEDPSINEEFKIIVSQPGRPTFECETETVLITDYANGSEETFNFRANVPWSSRIISTPVWFNCTPISGDIGKNISMKITANENPSAAPREGKIEIFNQDRSEILEITVKQVGRPAFENIQTYEVYHNKYTPSSESKTFTFTSNVENWWVERNVGEDGTAWFTVDPVEMNANGAGNMTLNINFLTENPTGNIREGSFTLYSGLDRQPQATIVVKQRERPLIEFVEREAIYDGDTLMIAVDTIKFKYYTGNMETMDNVISIKFISNSNVRWAISNQGNLGLGIRPYSSQRGEDALGQFTVNFYPEKNPTSAPRKGRIEFYAGPTSRYPVAVIYTEQEVEPSP